MQNSELDCNEEKRLKSNCKGKISGFQTEMSSINVVTQYVLCVKFKRLICTTHINYTLYKRNRYNQPMKVCSIRLSLPNIWHLWLNLLEASEHSRVCGCWLKVLVQDWAWEVGQLKGAEWSGPPESIPQG